METIENEARGIFQSDLLLRSALVEAIADLRAKPWLLDSVFASLRYDQLTNKLYGEKEVQRGIKWFQMTDIPVVFSYALKAETIPCISIEVTESSETENSLADIHYQTSQPAKEEWPPLTQQFTPRYVPTTGVITLPDDISNSLVCTVGMLLMDHNGDKHPILSIVDRGHFTVDVGLVTDFNNSYIKSSYPRLVETLESASFREGYRLGSTVCGDPISVLWLHSILSFCLLHYRQDLLESRGIERSSISSGPVVADQRFGKENVFSRFISLAAYVRNYWPKRRLERTLWLDETLRYSQLGNDSAVFVGDQGIDPSLLVQDGIGKPIIPVQRQDIDDDD
jgi:hypothetical protein